MLNIEDFKKDRDFPTKDESIQKDVDKIDQTLKNRNAKLDHSIHLYKNLKSEEMGYTPYSFYKIEENKIDRTQYNEFQTTFQYGIIHNFMNADLSQDSGDRSQPILLNLKVPKGSSMGYLKEDKVFIGRNQGFEVKDSMKIIVEKGREVIKVEAELVPAAKVVEKLKDFETKINNKFNTEMN